MPKKKIYASLASRITLGIFSLLIIPLLVFSTLIWERDWKFYPHLFIAMILVFLIGVLATFWLVKRIARPLVHLRNVIDEVASTDRQKRYIPDPLGFEINEIGQHFNLMVDSLLIAMEKAKNEKVARELLEKELQIGHEIQKRLLPHEIPQFPGLKMGAGFVPAKEVAGDFYDLFARDEDHLILAIGDGSDKGISACLHSLIVRSMLRSQMFAGEELGMAIKQINHLFCKDTADTGNFVTAWIGIYHLKSRTLSYTSAGHFPALIIHPDRKIEELNTTGIALGVEEVSSVEIKSITLPRSALLFLYTDGVIEAQNERGDLFGKSRLMTFLTASRSLEPQLLIENLTSEIRQFVGKAPWHDDFTVLGLIAL